MRKITPIGEILVRLGLVTPEQVQRALAHQRERGGPFGDALIELGLVTRTDVEWALADQYDLPMVSLHADAIDHAVASQVPAAWARERLILPVLRSGDTVTVLVSDPRDTARLDEVVRFTGAGEAEAALASPDSIRALIDAVHPPAAVALGTWIEGVVQRGAREMAISARGERVTAWDLARPDERRPLERGWEGELARRLSPSHPSGGWGRGAPRRWEAMLCSGPELWWVTCQTAGGEGASEWILQLQQRIPGGPPPVDAVLQAAVRERLRDGSAVVAAETADLPEALAGALLATLPAALLGAGCRAAHLAATAAPLPPGMLGVTPEPSAPEALRALSAFRLDAVTLGADFSPASVAAARGAAPLVVVRAAEGVKADLTLRLLLAGASLTWTLADPEDGAD